MIILLFSFDDTHYMCQCCANMLEKYNLKGTFYFDTMRLCGDLIPIVKDIGASHEIGAHSHTHRDLTQLSLSDIEYEIKVSKKLLEKILNCEVKTFAYPYGKYNNTIKVILRSNGFESARTTIEGSVYLDRDPLELKVTLGVWPHGYKFISKLIRDLNLYKLIINPLIVKSWNKLATYIIQKISDSKNKIYVFHMVIHCEDCIRIREEFIKFLELCSTLSQVKNYTISEYIKWLKSNHNYHLEHNVVTF